MFGQASLDMLNLILLAQIVTDFQCLIARLLDSLRTVRPL